MDEKKHDQAAKEGCDKSKVQSDPKMDPPTSPLALTIGPSASSSNPQPPKEPLEQQLSKFWAKQHQEVEETSESRNHCLPLARIKKIMKSDEDVRMVSAEAPVLLAKACEMFIMELTMRAWANVEENKRRTLSKNDIAAAMSKTDMYDFLVDIVPREETRGPQVFAGIPGTPIPPTLSQILPNCPVPPHNQHDAAGQQSGAPTMLMGMPLLDPTDPEQLQDRPSPTPMLPIPEEEDNPSPDSDD